MRITRNEKFAGVPMIKIRNLLKAIRDCQLSRNEMIESIASKIKELPIDADKLFNELSSAGYIEVSEGVYEVSQSGCRLSVARCCVPLTKQRAFKILEDFMIRVREVEANPEYLYRVKRALLFGSMLNPDAKDYGDVDIAVELESKIEDYDLRMKLHGEKIRKAMENGKVFNNIVSEVYYPEIEVKQYLKHKNRYISIHPISDIETFKCPFKELYHWPESDNPESVKP